MKNYKKIILFFSFFFSLNLFSATVIKESRNDENIIFVTKPSSSVVSVIQGEIDGATGNLEMKSGYEVTDSLSKDFSVLLGRTLFRPKLDVPSPRVVTNNGSIITIGLITGDGTLAGTGTYTSL